MNQKERKCLPPSPSTLAEIRAIFAGWNQTFVKNIIVDSEDSDTNNFKQMKSSLELSHPNQDLSFNEGYVVSEEGIIFDGKNYARWCGVSEGVGYAVYAKPEGQRSTLLNPKESREKLLQLIKVTSEGFPLVTGDKGWEEKIVKPAERIIGEKWQGEILEGLEGL